MQPSHHSRPIIFFFLVLPFGISGGFVSVTLPFVLIKAGFTVATAASIVALGASASVWRFVWGPVADLTFTLRRWYAAGLVACAGTLLLLGFIPLRPDGVGLLSGVVLLSQVAASFVVLPVGGMIAHTVAEEEKGRAAGWYQAANLGGGGLGGGVGVWLASHYSVKAAVATLAAAMVLCAVALAFVPDVGGAMRERFAEKIRATGRDFLEMLRSPKVLLTIFLVASPIGAGAAGNLWSAIAPDWGAGPNTVALVTGLLSGLTSAVGCVVGGWLADRVGRWWTYFATGALLALAAAIIAVSPRTAGVYATGVLFYAFSAGLAYAAFSALLLQVIGRGAASAKYAILSSLGNLPVVYMTALNGWLHDRSGVGVMLEIEALLGVFAVVLGIVALRRIGATAVAASNRAA
jgi:MFS family permease